MNEDKDDSCYKSISSHDIVIVIFWIGLWGFLETIIDKICRKDNIMGRLVVYFIIILISIYLNNLIVNYGTKIKNNNKQNYFLNSN